MSTSQHESAGGVVVDLKGKLVLVQQHQNSWSFPKGGVEEGETLLQAALREIREETGLTDLVLLGELGSYERKSIGKDGVSETDDWGTKKRTLFLFKTDEKDLVPQDEEISRVCWVSIEEALDLLTHPKDKEFLNSVRGKVQNAIQ